MWRDTQPEEHMPYIKLEDRKKFDDAINNLHLPADAGI